jgi:hypothetical protein
VPENSTEKRTKNEPSVELSLGLPRKRQHMDKREHGVALPGHNHYGRCLGLKAVAGGGVTCVAAETFSRLTGVWMSDTTAWRCHQEVTGPLEAQVRAEEEGVRCPAYREQEPQVPAHFLFLPTHILPFLFRWPRSCQSRLGRRCASYRGVHHLPARPAKGNCRRSAR